MSEHTAHSLGVVGQRYLISETQARRDSRIYERMKQLASAVGQEPEVISDEQYFELTASSEQKELRNLTRAQAQRLDADGVRVDEAGERWYVAYTADLLVDGTSNFDPDKWAEARQRAVELGAQLELR